MDSSVSFEGLWSIISETRSVYSTDVVGQELQALKLKFAKGILYYRYSDYCDSVNENDTHSLFIRKIVECLGVSRTIASEVFTSYLVFNFRGTHHSLSTLLSSERHQEALLVSVWKFYYSERLYLLMCLRCMIENKCDSSHPYNKLFNDFIAIINNKDELLTSLIDQLEYACNVVASSGLHHLQQQQGASGGGSLQSAWVSYMLKEQLELVLCLMAFTEYCARPNYNQVVSILRSCTSHGFGSSPTFAHLFAERHVELIRLVALMESILFVQCMRLDEINMVNDGFSSSEFLFTSTDSFDSVDNVLLGLGNSKDQGIVLLAWLAAMFTLGKLPKSRLKSLIDQVGKLNVIVFINQSVFNLPIVHSELTFVGRLVRRQLFHLISAVLQCFDTTNLCLREDLVELAARLLVLPENASDFWSQSTGLHLLLQDVALCFPVSIDLLKLCTGLLKSGSISVQKTIDLLSNVPYLAEVSTSVACQGYRRVEDGAAQVQLLEDRRAECSLISAGTLGLLVRHEGVELIAWRHSHNGWQYCMTLLDGLLGDALIDLNVLHNRRKMAFEVINLLCALLRCGTREHAIRVRFLVQAIMSVLGGHFSVAADDSDFFANCIALLSVYISIDPLFVWNNMENFQLLPVGDTMESLLVDSGRIGELIESRECVAHRYPLTCSFLELLVSGVAQPQLVASNSFRSSIAFVLTNIFPNHTRWHFRSASERLRIGSSCLRLFHHLLHSQSSSVSRMVEHCLLDSSAAETLLDMVLSGESRITSLLEQQSNWSTGAGVMCIRQTQIALSSLNQLLLGLSKFPSASEADSNSGNEGGAGKRRLTSLEIKLTTQPTLPNCLHPLLSIAQYVFHTHNPHLPILAIRLLLRLAQLFPMSLLASFGSDSDAICEMMLTRLRCECEDINLKRAIIDFVGSCAYSQPGLLQCLIGQTALSVPSRAPEDSPAGSDGGFLDVLLTILKEHQRSRQWHTPLFVSTAAALQSLWHVNCTAAISYMSRDAAFWSSLIAPLLVEPGESSDSPLPVVVVSNLLSVLTLHLFHLRRVSGDGDERLRAPVSAIFSGSRPLSALSSMLVRVYSEPVDDWATSDTDAGVLGFARAWSEWWVVVADIPWCCSQVPEDQRVRILSDLLVLCSLHLDASDVRSTRLVSCLLELFMVLSRRWHECVTFRPGSNGALPLAEKTCALVDQASARWHHVSRRSRTAVLTMLAQVHGQDDVGWQGKCAAPLLDILTMSLTESNHELEAVLAATGLSKILMTKDSGGQWLRLVSERSVVDVVLEETGRCMARGERGQLCTALLQLLIGIVSCYGSDGAYMCGEQLLRDVCLPLSRVTDAGHWRSVWTLCVQLMATLLQRQPEQHWSHVLTFITVHCDSVCAALCSLQRCADEQAVLQAEVSARLLTALLSAGAHVISRWHQQHPVSFTKSVRAASVCIGVCLSYLQHPVQTDVLVPRSEADVSSAPVQDRRRAASQSEPSCVLARLQRLLRVCCLCESVLLQAAPSLSQLLLAADCASIPPARPLVSASLGSTGPDQLSYGVLLACATLCCRHVVRDRPPGSVAELQLSRPVALTCLQQSLMLVLSQACSLLLQHRRTAHSSSALDDDVPLVCRELHSELKSLVDSCSKPQRRSFSMSPLPARTANTGSLSSEEQFFMATIAHVSSRILK